MSLNQIFESAIKKIPEFSLKKNFTQYSRVDCFLFFFTYMGWDLFIFVLEYNNNCGKNVNDLKT